VDAGECYSNRRQAVEKLVSAWNGGITAVTDGAANRTPH